MPSIAQGSKDDTMEVLSGYSGYDMMKGSV